MTWKDDLLPASFRGADFFYREVSRDGGRRLANHEFALRDDNSLEDLGKRAKVHRIQAYVLGDDYMTARDALEDALDEEGSATFVHPFKGNLTVGCPSYSVVETDEEGGIAKFEIVFIEDGKKPAPVSSDSTDDEAFDAADDQMDELGDDFSLSYVLDGLPGFIQDALAGNVLGLVGDLADLAGFPGIPVGLLGDALSLIALSFDDPPALGAAVPGFFRSYAVAAVDILPVNDPHLTSRGQPPAVDPTFGLGAFATWGDDLPQVVGTTPQRIQQRANQAALVALVQGSAIAALAQVYANTQFVSAQDAAMARSAITDMIDAQATIAGDAGQDAAFAGWMTVMRTVSADLTTRAQQLPNILTYRLGASLPALSLSQRIYQDGSRASELVSRNAAPHPLFMPLKIEALAA